ncbi:LUD domain-containing protein [Streptomyces niger]|uniref:LUD domain-containing protein n=1 Tax=Streptomyces niger TaxID=66373 RepID=UPI00069C30E8|nr:lactate utilization protein B [Streptomyces niger]
MTEHSCGGPTDGQRSTALAGRERIRPDRPEWAAGEIPAHRRPLPLITRDALTVRTARPTHDRLAALNEERHVGTWTPEVARLREQGAAIRRETLTDLEKYLQQLTGSVERNGAVVHRAGTPAEARAVIARIARENGVRLAVKSKSMATEEIHLNAHLNAEGVEVVETDLGEYIVQLADERPSHIVGPALHKSRQDVTDLFGQLAGAELSGEPEDLAAFARTRLRADFKAADLGISGVNFAAADTGTLAIVTNEGNADMVTSQPRVHVAVMTVEKVIPRFADLGVLVPLLCDAATKQRVSVYQTLVNGPRRAGESDGPEQLHLVILDNGRTKALGTPQEEVLACIRCGNCQISCPVYRTVGGGHPYSAVYGGPIGAVLSPLIGDPGTDSDLPFLSSLCGACYDACPVKIPIPDLLVNLRAQHESAPAAGAARAGWRAWGLAWRTGAGFRATLAAARLAGRLLPDRLLARLPGPGRGWAAGRALPPLREAGAFRRWFRRYDERRAATRKRDGRQG